MKYFYFLFFCLAMVCGQETSLKIKKPGKADFDYNHCAFDAEADAVILNEEGKMNVYPETVQIEINRRIKILTDKGKEDAVIVIPYYSGPHKIEDVHKILAYTINGTAENPVVTEVKAEEIHKIDVNNLWKEVRFTFPDVKQGSILDYSYIFETKNLMFVESWEFQHELPTERSYFSFHNNSGHEFNILIEGKELNRKLPNKGSIFRNVELFDLPSFEKIKHSYNRKDYINKLSFQHKNSAVSWKGLVKDKLNDLDMHKRAGAVKKMASEISPAGSDVDRFKAIATSLKQQVAWNSYYGQWPQKNINQILKDKEGSSADLNFLFWLLANELNVKSDLLMVSSRPNGKMTIAFPYLGQFDNLINNVQFSDGSNFIFDASDFDLNQLQYFPLKLSNHYGLLLNQDANFVSVKQPLSEYIFRQQYRIEDDAYKVLNNSKWTGYFNLENTAFEPDNALNQTVDMKKLPENGFSNGYYESAFTTYGKVPDDNIITLANPLYSLVSQFAVNDPDRNFAVEYDFPLMVKGNIIFEIPAGYEAIIPEEKIVSMKENIFYGQSFKQVEGVVVSNYQFLIGETVFEQKDIAALKQFIDTALEASKELVVLKRKH